MHKHLSIIVLFACNLGHSEEPAPVQGTPENDTKPQLSKKAIEDAIQQLGRDDYKARTKAEDNLKAFGPRAYDLLNKHANDPDMETRFRVRAILKEIRPSAVDLALDWLVRHQEADGHWDTRKHGADHSADLECTSVALIAFLGTGQTEKVGEYREHVTKALEWLRKNQRADGAFLNRDKEKVDGRWHALAGWAVAEAAGMSRVQGTMDAAQKAIEYSIDVHQTRKDNHPAGFGIVAKDSSPDLLPTVALTFQMKSAKIAALQVDPEAFDSATNTLKYLYDVETNSYRSTLDQPSSPGATLCALAARRWKGDERDALRPILLPALQSFGPPNSENNKYDILTVYCGTIAAFQQGGDPWREWNEALKKHLVESQDTDIDKDSDGSWSPRGPWKGKGRVWETALSSMALSVYYRYLPLYKE